MLAKGADFLTLYFSDADDEGHRWGEDAPAINDAVARLDAAVGRPCQSHMQSPCECRDSPLPSACGSGFRIKL